MRAIAPRTGAPEVTVAEDQLEYSPIVVARYDIEEFPSAKGLLTRWTLTPAEREAIANGEDLYLMQIVQKYMTPMMIRVGPGEWKLDG